MCMDCSDGGGGGSDAGTFIALIFLGALFFIIVFAVMETGKRAENNRIRAQEAELVTNLKAINI